jgi:hypothetical protein
MYDVREHTGDVKLHFRLKILRDDIYVYVKQCRWNLTIYLTTNRIFMAFGLQSRHCRL